MNIEELCRACELLKITPAATEKEFQIAVNKAMQETLDPGVKAEIFQLSNRIKNEFSCQKSSNLLHIILLPEDLNLVLISLKNSITRIESLLETMQNIPAISQSITGQDIVNLGSVLAASAIAGMVLPPAIQGYVFRYCLFSQNKTIQNMYQLTKNLFLLNEKTQLENIIQKDNKALAKILSGLSPVSMRTVIRVLRTTQNYHDSATNAVDIIRSDLALNINENAKQYIKKNVVKSVPEVCKSIVKKSLDYYLPTDDPERIIQLLKESRLLNCIQNELYSLFLSVYREEQASAKPAITAITHLLIMLEKNALQEKYDGNIEALRETRNNIYNSYMEIRKLHAELKEKLVTLDEKAKYDELMRNLPCELHIQFCNALADIDINFSFTEYMSAKQYESYQGNEQVSLDNSEQQEIIKYQRKLHIDIKNQQNVDIPMIHAGAVDDDSDESSFYDTFNDIMLSSFVETNAAPSSVATTDVVLDQRIEEFNKVNFKNIDKAYFDDHIDMIIEQLIAVIDKILLEQVEKEKNTLLTDRAIQLTKIKYLIKIQLVLENIKCIENKEQQIEIVKKLSYLTYEVCCIETNRLADFTVEFASQVEHHLQRSVFKTKSLQKLLNALHHLNLELTHSAFQNDPENLKQSQMIMASLSMDLSPILVCALLLRGEKFSINYSPQQPTSALIGIYFHNAYVQLCQYGLYGRDMLINTVREGYARYSFMRRVPPQQTTPLPEKLPLEKTDAIEETTIGASSCFV